MTSFNQEEIWRQVELEKNKEEKAKKISLAYSKETFDDLLIALREQLKIYEEGDLRVGLKGDSSSTHFCRKLIKKLEKGGTEDLTIGYVQIIILFLVEKITGKIYE